MFVPPIGTIFLTFRLQITRNRSTLPARLEDERQPISVGHQKWRLMDRNALNEPEHHSTFNTSDLIQMSRFFDRSDEQFFQRFTLGDQ